MSKAITVGAALLFFISIAIGLWALFRKSNALVASIALIFVVGGVVNTWGALKENRRRERQTNVRTTLG
jgi:hypothetical protein